jgi:dynamin 1-like protein
MIDMVPKAIMLNLVSRAKEELQRELLTELYKADVLDDLLHESEFTQERRKECKKMIEVRAVHDRLGLLLQLIFLLPLGTSKGRRNCSLSLN